MHSCWHEGQGKIKEIWDSILESPVTQKYDISIFELLSLSMKRSVIEEGVVVWARDRDELDYYFYKTRRIIQDWRIAREKEGSLSDAGRIQFISH